MTMNRAYAAFEIRSLDAERRTFRGWATTPAVDRMNDTIDPLGAKYINPLPLLHSHRHDVPLGSAWFEPPTTRGIEFEAEIASTDEPGPLKDRLDTAWQEVRAGVIRAVSVGFRPLEYVENEHGGYDFLASEIIELSICAVPANAEATIRRSLAAGGPLPADVVRLVAKANQPGIPLVRTTRPRFYIPG